MDEQKNSRRRHFWPEIIDPWLRFQKNGYGSADFCRENVWPSVKEIFYNEEVVVGMKKIKRWQAYSNLRIRPQNCYEHSISLAYLGYEIPAKINGGLYPEIDKEIIRKACMIHDIPEGLGLGDIPYAQKSSKRDVEEYLCFCSFLEKQGFKKTEDLKKIYLLQFCLNDIEDFPGEAKKIMLGLKKTYHAEIVWFKFLENFDYLLYAEEQYVRSAENIEILQKVAGAQVPVLIDLVDNQMPCLKKIWTPQAIQYFSQFIQA